MTPGAVDGWAMVFVFVGGMSVGMSVVTIVMRAAEHRAARRREALRRAAQRERPRTMAPHIDMEVSDAIVDWLQPAIQRAIDQGELVCHEPGNR